ncbi:unnamed protein product, partial [Ectocarpus sp. 4 AP-2014]
ALPCCCCCCCRCCRCCAVSLSRAPASAAVAPAASPTLQIRFRHQDASNPCAGTALPSLSAEPSPSTALSLSLSLSLLRCANISIAAVRGILRDPCNHHAVRAKKIGSTAVRRVHRSALCSATELPTYNTVQGGCCDCCRIPYSPCSFP